MTSFKFHIFWIVMHKLFSKIILIVKEVSFVWESVTFLLIFILSFQPCSDLMVLVYFTSDSGRKYLINIYACVLIYVRSN